MPTQRAVHDQLRDLAGIANQKGMYDAADLLWKMVDERVPEVAVHKCEEKLTEKHGDLTSGHWKEGTVLVCACGKPWVHICDEAEGCAWWPN